MHVRAEYGDGKIAISAASIVGFNAAANAVLRAMRVNDELQRLRNRNAALSRDNAKLRTDVAKAKWSRR